MNPGWINTSWTEDHWLYIRHSFRIHCVFRKCVFSIDFCTFWRFCRGSIFVGFCNVLRAFICLARLFWLHRQSSCDNFLPPPVCVRSKKDGKTCTALEPWAKTWNIWPTNTNKARWVCFEHWLYPKSTEPYLWKSWWIITYSSSHFEGPAISRQTHHVRIHIYICIRIYI